MMCSVEAEDAAKSCRCHMQNPTLPNLPQRISVSTKTGRYLADLPKVHVKEVGKAVLLQCEAEQVAVSAANGMKHSSYHQKKVGPFRHTQPGAASMCRSAETSKLLVGLTNDSPTDALTACWVSSTELELQRSCQTPAFEHVVLRSARLSFIVVQQLPSHRRCRGLSDASSECALGAVSAVLLVRSLCRFAPCATES